jgi:hypothetical protein
MTKIVLGGLAAAAILTMAALAPTQAGASERPQGAIAKFHSSDVSAARRHHRYHRYHRAWPRYRHRYGYYPYRYRYPSPYGYYRPYVGVPFPFFPLALWW